MPYTLQAIRLFLILLTPSYSTCLRNPNVRRFIPEPPKVVCGPRRTLLCPGRQCLGMFPCREPLCFLRRVGGMYISTRCCVHVVLGISQNWLNGSSSAGSGSDQERPVSHSDITSGNRVGCGDASSPCEDVIVVAEVIATIRNIVRFLPCM